MSTGALLTGNNLNWQSRWSHVFCCCTWQFGEADSRTKESSEYLKHCTQQAVLIQKKVRKALVKLCSHNYGLSLKCKAILLMWLLFFFLFVTCISIKIAFSLSFFSSTKLLEKAHTKNQIIKNLQGLVVLFIWQCWFWFEQHILNLLYIRCEN